MKNFILISISLLCFSLFSFINYLTNFNLKTDNINKDFVEISEDENMKELIVDDKKFYLVDNEEQLRSIGTTKYSLSDNYILNNDITLTKEWVPIGNDKNPFTGTFDGNGFKIINLKITDKNAVYVGLFGYAKGATICNITLQNVNIALAGDMGRHVGAILAVNSNSDVYNCSVIK